jgi:hypothetical protein
MDGKAVAEKEGFRCGQMRRNLLFVNRGYFRVRHGDKNNVGLFDRLGRVENREALLFGHRAALAARVKTDDNLHAAFFEVEGVGVAL